MKTMDELISITEAQLYEEQEEMVIDLLIKERLKEIQAAKTVLAKLEAKYKKMLKKDPSE